MKKLEEKSKINLKEDLKTQSITRENYHSTPLTPNPNSIIHRSIDVENQSIVDLNNTMQFKIDPKISPDVTESARSS